MSELAVALVIFALMLAAARFGGIVRDRLPGHHLSDQSRDAIKLGIGGLTTLAALVLGLLVASAKESFDTKYAEIQQVAARFLLLDTTLRQLGHGGDKPRELMRDVLRARVDYAWVGIQARADGAGAAHPGAAAIDQLERLVAAIKPADDAQRRLHSRALQLVSELEQLRWLIVEQSGRSISGALLVVLVVWLATIAAGIAILAPRNGTVRAIGVLCIAAVASTIFIILEMDQPFQGVVQIPDTPLRNVIANLNR